MATAEEIVEAYGDWQVRCNANTRLGKMLRGWDKVVHLVATDSDQAFTLQVSDCQLGPLQTGRVGTPDVVVTGSSEDFADMFWGDLNPSEKYMRGEIKLAGSAEDVLRLDAMSMMAFLDH